MKRGLKIALITLAAIFVLLIGAAFAIPYFFKDRILALVKEEANATLNARMDFQDVTFTLFRSFPDLTVRLHELHIDNIEPFEGVRLAAVKTADITLDIMSVLRNENPLKVKGIRIIQPKINVFVLNDGRANYDIVKPSEDTTTKAEPLDLSYFRVRLESYGIEGADVLYDDETLGMYLNIRGLTHKGTGDFTIDVYDLNTKTRIDSLTLRYGGITYLKNAKTTLDAIFNINQPESKYIFKDNNLKINELELRADGFVQLAEDDNIHMDLRVSTPQNEFRHLLSMIPNAYIAGYEKVKADGKFDLNAQAKGTYNGERDLYPAFQVNLGVENANVKYPDLPMAINAINTKVNINSPTSDFNDIVVNIPNFSMKLGNNPFKAIFNLKTPISDPDIDAKVDGVLNLRELSQAFPITGVDDLNGIITANMRAKTRMSYIDNQQYERVDMSGKFQVQNMNYQGTGYPLIRIQDARMDFTPRHVRLEGFNAKLGKSDVQASGYIDNILAYFSPKKTMTGQLTVRSNYFDANEWTPQEAASTAPAKPKADLPNGEEAEALMARPFDRFDFSLDARIGELLYDTYQIKDLVVKGNMKPNRLVAEDLRLQIGDSDVRGSGVILNLFDYLFDQKVLGGNVTIASNLMNLNQFMTTSSTTQPVAEVGQAPASSEGLEPIQIPDNIDIDIFADIKKLIYTNLEINNLKGKMVVEDRIMLLEEATASLLGGNVALAGSYDTRDAANPTFSFKYDLQKMDFQKSFRAFNTFQTVAPIAEFINGTFNTSLIMDGKLGKDMMPDLMTLSARGFLETINGVVQNFAPLQAIGDRLSLDIFKESLPITNSRNWFEIKNGTIEVQEFDYKYKGIDMKVGGTHNIRQEINYGIKAKIPRALLEKSGVGKAAGQGFDQLSKEAARLGLNLQKSEFVNVRIGLTGDIKKPKVDLQLLGADGETSVVESATQEAKDALKSEVEARVAEGKEAVREAAREVVDSAKTVLTQKAEDVKDELSKKAEDVIRDKVGSVVDSTLQKQGADKIREELDKFNPLKKKKSGS